MEGKDSRVEDMAKRIDDTMNYTQQELARKVDNMGEKVAACLKDAIDLMLTCYLEGNNKGMMRLLELMGEYSNTLNQSQGDKTDYARYKAFA